MVEIGFYEATAQIIPVLLFAEVARAAWFARTPTKFGKLEKQFDRMAREYEAYGESLDAIAAELDAQESQLADSTHPEVYVTALTERIEMGREKLEEARKFQADRRPELAGHQAEIALDAKRVRRDHATNGLFMALTVSIEIAALFLSLAVLAKPSVDSILVASLVTGGLAIGVAGTTTQILTAMVIRPQSRYERVVFGIQLIVPALVTLGFTFFIVFGIVR